MKVSVKTKLAMVRVVAVIGIGGGALYYHTFELNPVVVNEPGISQPEAFTEDASPEIEQASSPKNITAEEGKQLDAAIEWLKALDETSEGQAEPSEAQTGRVKQIQNGDESDNSIPDLRLMDKKKTASQPTETEAVLDIMLDWPAPGLYYLSDVLLYRPDIIDGYEDPADIRAKFEAAVAKNPYATLTQIDLRDPDSGAIVRTRDGRFIPAYIYFSDEYGGQ